MYFKWIGRSKQIIMKIVIATDAYYPQIIGSSYAVYHLAHGLKETGHNVTVFAPTAYGRNHNEKIGNLEVDRFIALPIPWQQDIRTALTPISVLERLRRIKPDVLHIHHPFLIGRSALTGARLLHIPTVITNHLLPESFLMFLPKQGTLNRYEGNLKFTWHFVVGFCNKACFVTSPTQKAVSLLKEHGLKVKAKVISNGIELNRFDPHRDGEYLRQRFSIPRKPVVLYTGRLSEEKRVDILIKAIPYVLRNIKVHFLITGDGPLREALRSLAKRYKVEKFITFTGFLNHDDYPDIYTIADLFVMPSLCELQSISTLEALASGLPVIAAKKYALPELVHPGENGFLFKPGSSEDLAGKIVKILSNSGMKERMGRKSLEIVKFHSLQRTVEEYEKVYSNVKYGYELQER